MRHIKRLVSALVFVGAFSGVLAAQSSAPVQYFYDDVGRLIKMIDANDNVATYTYDSVGNIVSISRSSLPSSNALAILNFTPQQGGIGSTVTIQGQNFSSTPGSNTVQFNGTPATVSLATANSLTVTVPTGPTTDPTTLSLGPPTPPPPTTFTLLHVPLSPSI